MSDNGKFRCLLSRLPRQQFSRILDAGYGEGSNASEIARACFWAKIRAIDLVPGPLPAGVCCWQWRRNEQ